MPRLRQPPTLRDFSVEILAQSVGKYCVHLVNRVNTSNLERDLKLLKLEVCDRVPAPAFDKFTVRMLQVISNLLGDRSEWISIDKIDSLLDLVMDHRLTKLECFSGVSGKFVYGMGRGLAKLGSMKIADFSAFPLISATALAPMTNLTTLTYRETCTDEVLEVIGQHCFQLTHLDVSSSRVTDHGMCSMRSCTMLRTIQFRKTHVSTKGVLEFLTTHPKIVDLGSFYGLQNWLPATILQGITDGNKNFRYFDMSGGNYDDLKLLPIKCPNLSGATFTGLRHYFHRDLSIPRQHRTPDVIELSVLEELRELKELHCDCVAFFDIFLRFLPFNASRITTLDLSWSPRPEFSLDIDKLNVIHETCVNLESFEFSYIDGGGLRELDLPPFPKLKTLKILAVEGYPTKKKLNLNTMTNLETLCYFGFYIPVNTILFIIRDSENFPKLSIVITDGILNSEALTIMEHARKFNLDFAIVGSQPAL